MQDGAPDPHTTAGRGKQTGIRDQKVRARRAAPECRVRTPWDTCQEYEENHPRHAAVIDPPAAAATANDITRKERLPVIAIDL
jgi:hypothetical protein